MRIVVTGVAGFIGSNLAEALIGRGHEVVGLDAFIDYYPKAVKQANLAGLAETPAFRFGEIDLRTDDLDPWLEGADAIVHEAAMAGLMRSWTDLELYASCNILATNRLIEAARRAGALRLVFASTSSVYGTEAVGDEDRPLEPSSPYGITKLAAEKLVLAHTALHGLPATIVRYFSIYGPRQRPDMAYHRFIEAMLDGQPITVYGDGEQTRSNTYIDDAVTGTILALERGEIGGIYNIGGGRTISLNAAISLIAGHLGVEPIVVREPARPGDQRHTSADVSRARLALRYEPRVEPSAGLARQVDWHRARRGAGQATGRT
ncbi:MAG TPA: NAD-dependent epimerase/dehydratase family protein [Candidatus Limnocylindrales bacterium]|nr:NAD-dependent epimerase/dehydratase family protein [Candidatus Limnocylindrales bacterium]